MLTLRSLRDSIPFTPGGMAFAGASAAAFWVLGVGRTDHIFLVLGGAGLALWFLGMVLTMFGAAMISLDTHFGLGSADQTNSFVAGIWQRSGYERSLPWWLPLVQLSWEWSNSKIACRHPDGREEICPHRRGEWTAVSRRLMVQDAFRLSQMVIVNERQMELRVRPDISGVAVAPLVFGLQGGNELPHPSGKPRGDRIDLRRYVVGDPVKHILWKIYARTGELVVRTPERAVQTTQRMVAYLILSEQDSCAAALASVALSSDSLGEDWRFGCDSSTSPIRDEASAQEVIIQSGSKQDTANGEGLGDFLDHAIEGRKPALLIFAPPSSGWLSRIIAERNRAQITVLIGVDRFLRQDFRQQLRNWALQSPIAHRPEASSLSELIAIVGRLTDVGIRCAVYDRESGRTFSSDELYASAIPRRERDVG